MTQTAEEQIRAKAPLATIRELWYRTIGAEVVERLGLEVVIRAGPYKDLSDAPEPRWEYQLISVDCKCGPGGLDAVEDVLSVAHERMRNVLKEALGSEKGLRIHPQRSFKMSPFALEALGDGTKQWHATVLLAFQRLPVADVRRLRGR